eukprot:GFYU01010039.1.p1 GENE.GFYU01010039.1~~GFYU01010039.1.p1  ORF type:complete len:372 (+),score=68.01 GFYU01010039.1:135-1250(+)
MTNTQRTASSTTATQSVGASHGKATRRKVTATMTESGATPGEGDNSSLLGPGHLSSQAEVEMKTLSPDVEDVTGGAASSDRDCEFSLIRRSSGVSGTKQHSCYADTLVTWEEAPSYLQFNPFVKTGYRKELSYLQCWESLLHLHNETGNVLTHGSAGIVYLALASIALYNLGAEEGSMHAAILLSSLVTMILSCAYHTFMCHSKDHYQQWLVCDIIAIWFYLSVSCFVMIIAYFHCYPILRGCWLAGFSVACLVSFIGLVKSRHPGDRLKWFSVVGLAQLSTLLIRIPFLLTSTQVGTWYSVGLFVLAAFEGFIGGYINAKRIPERYYPGKFDYWFNSHQIFHICSGVAIYHSYLATSVDIQDFWHGTCPS